jgi:asparagine synthase (glutamine-hydrolysing)
MIKAEFCMAIPERQFLRQGQDRWLLRRAMGEVLPMEILASASRGYQVADWYEATAAALPRIREELEGMIAHGRVDAYIDLDALLQSLDAWPHGDWANQAIIDTYRSKLLRGLALGMFIRQVEGEPC